MSLIRYRGTTCLLATMLLVNGVVAQSGAPNRLVDSIRGRSLKTSADLLDAVEDLIRVGEFELCKEYLQRFQNLSHTRESLADLHRQFGSAFFISLRAERELAPLGGAVADRVLEAKRQQNSSLRYLDRQIDLVQSDRGEERRLALTRLQDIGPAAVVRILERQVHRQGLRRPNFLQFALVDLATTYPRAVWGGLHSESPALRRLAAGALAHPSLDQDSALHLLRCLWDPNRIGSSSFALARAVQSALGRVPTASESTALLREAVERSLFDNLARPEGEFDAPVTLWFWNEETLRPQSRTFSPPVALGIESVQVAEDLLWFDPGNEVHCELYLACVLATGKWAAGWEQPLRAAASEAHTFAEAAPVVRLESLLRQALERRQIPLALAVCEVLESARESGPLQPQSPVLDALRDPHPRVRHAALKVVMHTSPRESLKLERDFWKEIGRTTTSRGERRVLILDPMVRRGESLAGLLQTVGFVVERSGDPRAAYRRLRESADFEALLLHQDWTQPAWSEIVQQLRHDHWTRQIPIGILYTHDPRVEPPSFTEFDYGMAFPTPVDFNSATWLMGQLAHAVQGPEALGRVPASERLEWAREAERWLKNWNAESAQTFIQGRRVVPAARFRPRTAIPLEDVDLLQFARRAPRALMGE